MGIKSPLSIFPSNALQTPILKGVRFILSLIYIFELTDKATNKQQRSKVVVQH